LARYGEQVCRTQEEMKAWSQNLGHEKVQTTFSRYGDVAPHRQAEIPRSLAKPRAVDDNGKLAQILKIIGDRPVAAGDGDPI
jgi:hypothetical protein